MFIRRRFEARAMFGNVLFGAAEKLSAGGFFLADHLRDFAGGWTAHIETLETVLEGKSANHFWADVVAAHAAYGTRIS